MAPKFKKKDKNGRKMASQPSEDLPMRRFIENVPEDEFSAALDASGDPKFQNFLLARCDPAYRQVGFAALCRKFNISLQDVDDLWRSHQLHRGMIRMMNQVPVILEDVAEDAKSRTVVCPRCDGLLTLINDKGDVRPCPVCKETGMVRQTGDKAARELVFESIGLTGKRGPMVAIQQNFGLDSGLEDVLMATQRVISGGNE